MPESDQQEYNLEFISDGVMTRNMDGQINFWNHGAEELYGWREKEAIGRISHQLLKTQFPKPLQEIESELLRNGRWEGPLVHTTRGGSSVVVQSRWTLSHEGTGETVLEINTPANPHATSSPANRKARAGQLPDQKPSLAERGVRRERFLSRIAKLADLLLIAGSALASALTIYVIYYYTLSGHRELLGTIHSVFYAIPAGIAVLLFSALWWTPHNKINLAMVFMSCALTVYTGELLMRLWEQPRTIWLMHGLSTEEKQQAATQIAKRFNVKFDIRDRLEVIKDLREQGIDAVPAVIPRELLVVDKQNDTARSAIKVKGEEAIPLGGVANKKTVMCNESGRWITYVSDEHGFNNPAGIWQSAKIDVAALGDSFTQGYCVPPEKSFVGLIRSRYPATLNLGMAGNGPLYMLASLREYLSSYKPKLVLWFYFEGNDLTDLQSENKSPLLMQYLHTGFRQGLSGKQGEIDQELERYIQREAAKEADRLVERNKRSEWAARLMGIAKLDKLRKRLGLVYGTTPEQAAQLSAIQGPGMNLFRNILSQAKADVDGWGGKLYFVYLPGWGRYVNSPELGDQQRDQVLAIARSLDIPVIDIHRVFQAQSDPLLFFPFRGSGHYNAAGHQLVAEEVLKVIDGDIGGQATGKPRQAA